MSVTGVQDKPRGRMPACYHQRSAFKHVWKPVGGLGSVLRFPATPANAPRGDSNVLAGILSGEAH